MVVKENFISSHIFSKLGKTPISLGSNARPAYVMRVTMENTKWKEGKKCV